MPFSLLCMHISHTRTLIKASSAPLHNPGYSSYFKTLIQLHLQIQLPMLNPLLQIRYHVQVPGLRTWYFSVAIMQPSTRMFFLSWVKCFENQHPLLEASVRLEIDEKANESKICQAGTCQSCWGTLCPCEVEVCLVPMRWLTPLGTQICLWPLASGLHLVALTFCSLWSSRSSQEETL